MLFNGISEGQVEDTHVSSIQIKFFGKKNLNNGSAILAINTVFDEIKFRDYLRGSLVRISWETKCLKG